MELCIALDLPTRDANLQLVRQMQSYDIWFKVGLRSFIRDGKEGLEEIKQTNPKGKIFLDLKLYDIPNTMGDSFDEIAKLPVDMVSIHTSSGLKAMQEIKSRLAEVANPPLVMAVMALTSFCEEDFFAIYQTPIVDFAKKMIDVIDKACLDGMICSVFEAKYLKATAPHLLALTPGIRPFGEERGDQNRVATIQEAKRAQSDFIVIGRPIYQAQNPQAVVEKILKECKGT